MIQPAVSGPSQYVGTQDHLAAENKTLCAEIERLRAEKESSERISVERHRLLNEAIQAMHQALNERDRLRALQASLIEALTNLLAQNKGPEWAWARLVLNEAIAYQQTKPQEER